MESDILSKKIVEILSKKARPLTTSEIEDEVNKLGLKCPDNTIAYLNQLRNKGIIKGELSIKQKSWIWWA
ncbi:MAG: hypothetical protein ACTSYR_00210 [Candidatus Odinarchaeia archaeon]